MQAIQLQVYLTVFFGANTSVILRSDLSEYMGYVRESHKCPKRGRRTGLFKLPPEEPHIVV
jgi:hypothetical protein